jgi:hypothetical protein
MTFINPGMFSNENLALLAHCVDRLPSNAAIVEIVSFAGLSLNHIVRLLRMGNRINPMFSVDEWKFEGYEAGQKIENTCVSFDEYRAHVIETFRRNVQLFSRDRLPHHIEIDSDSFFAAWAKNEARTDFFGRRAQLGGPIALVYIDGDHSYEQSKRDFENVDRYLESGGFVVFDDSADGSGWGSAITAKEAANRPNYDLVAKTPNYCVRKR